MSDTARNTGAGAPRAAPRDATLTIALRRDRPGWVGSTHLLAGVDRVHIGRGTEPPRRSQQGGEVTLHLALDEAHVSQRHATLHRAGATWVFTHQSQTNESVIQGQAVGSERAVAERSSRPAGGGSHGVRSHQSERAERPASAAERRGNPPDSLPFSAAEASRHVLQDGDVIEISPFLLVFRNDQPFTFGDEVLAPPLPGWRTFHRALAQTYREAAKLAPSLLPVLVLGPTGAGKERIAHGIHQLSGRAGPFTAVNCAAFSPAVLDSELFGHKKGAFTGATQDREGLIRASHRGTLFLDEVADMPAALQDRLLRVLETKQVRPIGGDDSHSVDLRIVAATNKPLDEWFRQPAAGGMTHGFREDLYYRLGGEPLRLPSLPERREDLGLMIAEVLSDRPLALDAAVARALMLHPWPGGARQLRSVIERLLIRVDGRMATLEDLRLETPEPPEPPEAADGRKYTRAQVEDALRRARGSLPEAARLLGCNRTYVHKLVERWGLGAFGHLPNE